MPTGSVLSGITVFQKSYCAITLGVSQEGELGKGDVERRKCIPRSRGDGSAVQSPYCPCRVWGLVLSTHNVAHDHGQPVTPVHGDLAPFLSTRHARATHTYMQASTRAH